MRRIAAWLLALTLLFIVYASLYPFDFDLERLSMAASSDSWARSFTWRTPPRSDLIANLIFYLPFGALTTYLGPRHWSSLRLWLLALTTGIGLSLMIECAQFATRDRVPALTDIVVNGLSAALASAAVLGARGLGVRPPLPQLRAHRPDPIALLLVFLWLAFHVWPFMPTARFLRYFRDPGLLLDQYVPLTAVAGYFAGYVLLGAALRNLLRPASFWPLMGAIAVVSLLARIAFRGQRLELAECAGLILAVPMIWSLARAYDQQVIQRVGTWVVAAMAVFLLAPFDFHASAAYLSDAPPLSLAHRSAAHEPGILETAFLYIGCVWLAEESGLKLRQAVPWLFAAAVFVEVVQGLQPGHGGHVAGPVAIVVGTVLVRARRFWIKE